MGKTKYNLNKATLCEGLTAEKLKSLGFTNYSKDTWYFCRTISYKDSRFSETLNISIDNKTFTKLEIDILDEAFLQPAMPYYRYYTGEITSEECSSYIQNGIKKCDEHIQFLIDNNVLKIETEE